MAEHNKWYSFHVLYKGAYDQTVTGICTEFCDKVLLKFASGNKEFFYPKYHQEHVGGPPENGFQQILQSCDRSLVLLSNEPVECELYDNFLEKTIQQRDEAPIFSVRLGDEDYEELVRGPQSFLNPINFNCVRETDEINSLLRTLFDNSNINVTEPEIADIFVPDDLKQSYSLHLIDVHNKNLENLREKDALTRWIKTYKLEDSVETQFSDLGIESKDELMEFHDQLEFNKNKSGFNIKPANMESFLRGVQDLKEGNYIWREKLDSHVLKSKLYHLATTVSLKQKSQAINNTSAFIADLSDKISHPANCLYFVNQSENTIITFIAKCSGFVDLNGLHQRLLEKAANFEEPFCVLENTEFFHEKSEESNRPLIASNMIDISEEYDRNIFQLDYFELSPDEILVQIFQWLPFITKVTVLPEVCERWKNIATEFILFPIVFNFNEMSMQSINESMNFIFDTIARKENLRPNKLILPEVNSEETDKNETIINLLETGVHLGVWKSLTKLSAREININEEVFSNFVSSLNSEIFTELSIRWMTPNKMYSICRHLKKLQRFIIWDVADAESLQHLVNAGSGMKYLREQRINVKGDVPVNIVTNILQNCGRNFDSLTLYLHRIEIDSNFMQSLSLCRNLKYLYLWLLRMSYNELCRTLSSMKQLEQLHLDAPGLTGNRIRESSLLQELNNLRHVYLRVYNLQDNDVTDLCINCGHCLETIHLASCPELTDTAMTRILTNCNKLVVLKLKYCENINKVKLLEKLTENPENYLPQLVLLNLIVWSDENEIPGDVLSNCLTARPQLFIKEENNSIDEISASSVLHKILGPNCHHRKQLVRNLISRDPINSKQDCLDDFTLKIL